MQDWIHSECTEHIATERERERERERKGVREVSDVLLCVTRKERKKKE